MFLVQHTLLNIYRALIFPYLSYGLVVVWGQASKTLLTKILSPRKKVLRFIFFANRNIHAIPFFIIFSILSPYLTYCMIFILILHPQKSLTCFYRYHLFIQDHPLKIISKKNNLEKLRQAVSSFGAKLWNEIPGRMRDMSLKYSETKIITLMQS